MIWLPLVLRAASALEDAGLLPARVAALRDATRRRSAILAAASLRIADADLYWYAPLAEQGCRDVRVAIEAVGLALDTLAPLAPRRAA